MKNKYRNLRLILFVVFTIMYYVLGVFFKDGNLKLILYFALIGSVVLGVSLLIFDIRKLETNKKRLFSFLLLLIMALSLQYMLETYFYNFNLSVKIIMMIAFIIFYSLYINFEVFTIKYK